jgi:hypothetical protein
MIRRCKESDPKNRNRDKAAPPFGEHDGLKDPVDRNYLEG